MLKMIVLKKFALAALAAVLVFTALPLATVSAQEGTPPVDPALRTERLEKIWARQQQIYERLGMQMDGADDLIARSQERIDQAKANGKDVTALQAALDAFKDAVKKAHPVYESSKGILNSHQGFDASGKVTDLEKARQTVAEMQEKLKEIRSILGPAGQALREAVRAFRDANRPARPQGGGL